MDIPSNDTILILCSKNGQEIVGDKCVGILPTGFRIDEDGLSFTWLDYFNPPPPSIDQATEAMARQLKTKKSFVLARVSVRKITEIADRYGIRSKFMYDPLPANKGHVLLTDWPVTEEGLLALTQAFVPESFEPVTNFPAFGHA